MNADPKNIPMTRPWFMVPIEVDQTVVHRAFNQLIGEAHRNSVDQGWWHEYRVHNPKDVLAKLMKIVTELAEVATALRAGRWRAAARPATKDETDRLGVREIIEEGALEELVDVQIRNFDLLGACVVGELFTVEDYVAALIVKMKENCDRARHVGKRF